MAVLVKITQRCGVYLLILFLLSVTLPGPCFGDFSYYSIIPADGSTVSARRPVIRWPVNLNGYSVSKLSMELDGAEVKAGYDYQQEAIVYKPDKELGNGYHRIKVRLDVLGHYQVVVSSEFKIVETSDPYKAKDMEEIIKWEDEGLAWLNKLRKALGLPSLAKEPALSRSAQSHTNYLKLHTTVGHEEIKGAAGFTGSDPQSRAVFFGYSGYTSEGINSGTPNGSVAIDQLNDAPYHRLSIINPNLKEAGIGFEQTESSGNITVVNYGTTGPLNNELPIMYPYPGQTNVKISWYVAEEPNPLRTYGKDRIYTGYPISISVHDQNIKELKAVSTSIKDNKGRDVPFYLVDSSRDDKYKDMIFLIPREPLEPGTNYTVSIKAVRVPKSGASTPIERNWSFTTLEKLGVMDASVITLNGNDHLKLVMQNGDLPDLQYTLTRNGETYREYSAGELSYYVYKQKYLQDDEYTLEIKSPRFREETRLPLIITSNGGKRIVILPSDNPAIPIPEDPREKKKPENATDMVVKLNGKPMAFDVNPVLEGGRVLVPLRAILESLGARVSWDDSTLTATAIKGSTSIKLQVGGKAWKNGREVTLEVPARVINGRTMVPLRFVGESMGAAVQWDSATKIISINYTTPSN